MKICRFIVDNKPHPLFGVMDLDRQTIRPLQSNNIFEIKKMRANQIELTAEPPRLLSEVKLLSPVTPSKIVCVGRNYAAHARELGNEVPAEPLLFLKAPSSLIVSGEAIKLPAQSNQVEHEGELAVVIGQTIKNLSATENPLDYVCGYACLNDVTARDLQRSDVQFTRAKSFDTFCPISNFIETELNPAALNLTVSVNGAVKQSGNTREMIFSVAKLIQYISRQMTLLPGDLIATGTPAGVSQLQAGDVCTVEIENLGTLQNRVELSS